MRKALRSKGAGGGIKLLGDQKKAAAAASSNVPSLQDPIPRLAVPTGSNEKPPVSSSPKSPRAATGSKGQQSRPSPVSQPKIDDKPIELPEIKSFSESVAQQERSRSSRKIRSVWKYLD